MAVLPPHAPVCASCAARDAVIAEQARVLEEQAAAIGELRAGVVALAAEVRDLRRRLGRNSGNSSMAPSADDLPGRTPVPLQNVAGFLTCAVYGVVHATRWQSLITPPGTVRRCTSASSGTRTSATLAAELS
jgi:tetrahydromethanopterin S-methyltransferase subunit B